MDPDDPDPYLRLAEIYRQMKQLDKAEQNIVQAKQRAPNNLEVIYYEATIYEDQGRIDDSIRVLSDAVTRGEDGIGIRSFSRRRTLAILLPAAGAVVSRNQAITRRR